MASKWACPACTYQNEASAVTCEACEGLRESPGDQVGGPWACQACTLQNDATATACTVCGTPRRKPATIDTVAEKDKECGASATRSSVTTEAPVAAEDRSITVEVSMLSGEVLSASMTPGSTVLDLRHELAAQQDQHWPMLRVTDAAGIDLDSKCSVEDAVAKGPLSLFVIPNRDEAIFKAKLAASMERVDDMVRYCICFAELAGEGESLNEEETRLVKQSFSLRQEKLRSSWRMMSLTEEYEQQRGNALQASFCREERERCEAEFQALRGELDQLLTTYIVPRASSREEAQSWQDFLIAFTLP